MQVREGPTTRLRRKFLLTEKHGLRATREINLLVYE